MHILHYFDSSVFIWTFTNIAIRVLRKVLDLVEQRLGGNWQHESKQNKKSEQ